MKANELHKRASAVAAVGILALFISACSYLQEVSEERDKAHTDLSAICAAIPIPKDFTGDRSYEKIDIGIISLFRQFKTRSRCQTVQNHFLSHFSKAGWDPDRMSIEEANGGGMKTTDLLLRKDGYLVWVACQNDVAPDDEKVVAVSCSWGLRNY